MINSAAGSSRSAILRMNMEHNLDIQLTPDMLLWQALVLTAMSFVVGILGGFVGLALGTMRLPAMLLMGMAAPAAGGTNILVSSLASLTGAIRHLREGRVNLRIVLIMGVPAFIGAFIGGFGAGEVPESLLIFLAGLLVFWQGVELIARVRDQHQAASGSGGAGPATDALATFTRNRILLQGGVGLAVGLLGGAVGLILGSIRLHALIRILRVAPRLAAGTNAKAAQQAGEAEFHGKRDYSKRGVLCLRVRQRWTKFRRHFRVPSVQALGTVQSDESDALVNFVDDRVVGHRRRVVVTGLPLTRKGL